MSTTLPTVDPQPDVVDNPYVGPRSFRYGEHLYGRDREIAELRDVLIAQRIVLLYSPSGAGKSSLLEAGLRPELEQRDFRVLPTVRVGHDVPPALEALPVRNRYVLSTLLSLEEGRPAEQQLRPTELAQIEIDGYLARITQEDEADRATEPCLIFDQFEELFTLDPTDQRQKWEYLEELGIALRDRGRWALFAMREDFIAQLDPYVALIPKRFSSRYRLDLLGIEGAQLAMRRPAEEHGRPFNADAATRLVDDLRQMRVQRGDTVVEEHGPYVEPVQLQVVCRQLWSSLSTDAVRAPHAAARANGHRAIELADVIALGRVDDALAAFYDECVRLAAAATGAREREIRAWFEDELITEQGFRAQVLEGPGERGAAVLRELENAHVIRADSRRGINWYEISHDRLVAPIRASNAAWRDAHLSTLQREAPLWEAQARPAGLLITGSVLADAKAWAAAHPDDVLPVDREYLQASEDEERRVVRERRSSRRNKVLALLSTTIGIVAVVALVIALLATRARSRAEARTQDERKVAATEAVVKVLRASEGSVPDLSGIELEQAQLQHISLPYVGLRGADVSGADLTGANLSFTDLQGTSLSGATLEGADLTGANLARADLTWADLSLANLTDANITGVDWADARCPDGSDASTHDQTCDGHLVPAGGEFSGDLIGLDLTGRDLTGVIFSDADLRLTIFGNTDGVTWRQVRCPNGRESEAAGGSCDGQHDFVGGRFEQVQAPGVRLAGNLSGADFTGANLQAAWFNSTYLAGADLSGADLRGARITDLSADDLVNTDLHVASLAGATLSSVDLRGVDFGEADTTGLFPAKEVCRDDDTVGLPLDQSASQCGDADARITVRNALLAADADELLAMLDDPTGFEYLRAYLSPTGLLPNGLTDYIEPPPRNLYVSADPSEPETFVSFTLQLRDDVAALFADRAEDLNIYDGAVSWSIALVPAGAEWRVQAGSFCDFLTQLELYYALLVGPPSETSRPALDACPHTLPQTLVGPPELATEG
ncbi:MAG: pentapeptide repeat-containing protein [Acidimicrobiia bacterium]